MTLSRMIARPMLASIFVVGAVGSWKNASAMAPQAATVTDRLIPRLRRAAPQLPLPSDPATLVKLNAAVHLAAAGAFATGRAPRISALVLASTLVPTTLAGHAYWEESDPGARANQKMHFFKNVSVLGGLLLAGVDTEGKPGMAWRARRAARDVRREAKHLGRAARREAKLAKAQLG